PFPLSRRRAAGGDLAAHFPATDANREPGCKQTGAAECNGWEHSQHHAERRISGGRRERAGADDAPAPRSQHRICQIGEAADRCGDWRLGMSERVRLARKKETANEVPPIVQDVLSSSGQPLNADTRDFME